MAIVEHQDDSVSTFCNKPPLDLSTHKGLVADLTAYLRNHLYMAIPETKFGPATMGPDSQIPDVMRIRKSYAKQCFQIYEVKASRVDFMSDMRHNKWTGYLPMCNQFFFAVAPKVCDKDEIPDKVGLLIRYPEGWKVIKHAAMRPANLRIEGLLSFIFHLDKEVETYKSDIAALKKLKHIHNKWANVKMNKRMEHAEMILHEQESMYNRLKDIRDIIKSKTGCDIGSLRGCDLHKFKDWMKRYEQEGK